jgi:transposase
LAEDEMSMHLQATIMAVWAAKRQTPVVRAHPGREKTCFYGSLSLLTAQDIVTQSPVMNAETTAQHLNRILETLPGQPILLFWDRAPWPSGQPIKEVLAENPRLEILCFPVAAPELNAQEHVWKVVRRAASHNHSLPTKTEGPAPAAEGKWCSGTKTVFFPGGSSGGPFATVVYNGAVAAADLGADVEYVWSDRNPEKIVTQFAEAAATKPDGIAIMGHHGDDAVSAVVADAEAQGIIVTGQNTTLPTLEAQYKTSGFGYVGAERYSAGYALGPRQSVALGLGLAIRPWSGVSWHRLAVASGPRA